jgi:rhodanese-related sulfurtransferase
MGTRLYKEQLPHQMMERINKGEVLEILDVREPDEWESGHIPGAKHIPLSVIAKALSELDPKKETFVVCRSGGRSSMACDFLSSMGYNVVNMPGGMLEWPGELKYGK